jgi:hypothetical protein
LVVASAIFIVGALALGTLPLDADLPLPLVAIYAGTLATITASIRLIARPGTHGAVVTPPRWDLPARMIVATALVLAVTSAAPYLGARLTGLLTTYPIYASVLAAFAHVQRGRDAAIDVVRGLCFGLFAFATFFFTLAALIERAGIGVSFAAATLAAVLVQMASLGVLRLSQSRVDRELHVPLERT